MMIERLRDLLGNTTPKTHEECIEAKLLVYASGLIVAMLVLYLGLDGRGI